MHLLVTPRQLRARPRENRRIPDNSIPADLERAVHVPDGIRLEFAGGLRLRAPANRTLKLRSGRSSFPHMGSESYEDV